MKKVILLFALAIILGASYFTISSVLDRPYLTVYNPHDFSGIDRDNYGMCECLLIEGSTHVEIYSLNGKKIKGKNEQVEVHYNPLNKTFAASVNGEWGLFDKNGEEIVQPEYKSCAFYPFSSYVFLLAFDGELAVFDDDFGKVLFTKPVRMLRDVSCLTQSQESKWFFLADDDVGLMNHAGNEVFRTEGTSRSNVTSTGNVVVVKKDNVEFYDSTFSVIGERSLQNVKYRDIGLTQNEMLKKNGNVESVMDVVSPDQDKGPFFWGEHGHSIEFYSSDCVLLATIPRCPVAYLGGGFYFLNGEIEDTITNFTGIEKTFENGCFPQGFFAAGRLSVLDEGLNQCVVLDSSLSEIALVPNGICKREDISRVHPFLLANCGLSIAKLKGNQGYVVLNYQGEAVFETVWDRVSGHKDYAGCFTVYTPNEALIIESEQSEHRFQLHGRCELLERVWRETGTAAFAYESHIDIVQGGDNIRIEGSFSSVSLSGKYLVVRNSKDEYEIYDLKGRILFRSSEQSVRFIALK